MGTHPIFESDFDCLTGCMELGETRDLGRPPENRSNRRGFNYQGIRGRGRGRGRGNQSNNRGGNNIEGTSQSDGTELLTNQNGENQQRRFYNHGNRPPPRSRNTNQLVNQNQPNGGDQSNNVNEKPKKRNKDQPKPQNRSANQGTALNSNAPEFIPVNQLPVNLLPVTIQNRQLSNTEKEKDDSRNKKRQNERMKQGRNDRFEENQNPSSSNFEQFRNGTKKRNDERQDIE